MGTPTSQILNPLLHNGNSKNFFLESELIGFGGHLHEEEKCVAEEQTGNEEDVKIF